MLFQKGCDFKMFDGKEGGHLMISSIPQLLLSLGGKERVKVCDNYLQVISFLNRNNRSVVVAFLSILMQSKKLGKLLLFSRIFGALSLTRRSTWNTEI